VTASSAREQLSRVLLFSPPSRDDRRPFGIPDLRADVVLLCGGRLGAARKSATTDHRKGRVSTLSRILACCLRVHVARENTHGSIFLFTCAFKCCSVSGAIRSRVEVLTPTEIFGFFNTRLLRLVFPRLSTTGCINVSSASDQNTFGAYTPC